jgi:predicted cobalt transporter CbtA
MGLLSGIGTAAMFVLLIRLVGPFGGWADWFVWVWLAGMAAIVVAVFRAALVWPELPWRAEDAKTRRSEAGGLGFSAVIALIIAGGHGRARPLPLRAPAHRRITGSRSPGPTRADGVLTCP